MVSLPIKRNISPEKLQASRWLKPLSPAVPAPGPAGTRTFSHSAAKDWEAGAEESEGHHKIPTFYSFGPI